jgi:hypothetical protein
MYFFNSAKKASLEETESISILKHVGCRKYSFQTPTQFSQGNNVLDPIANNTDGFQSRETYVSLIQVNRPICNKMSLSTLKNISCRKYSFLN